MTSFANTSVRNQFGIEFPPRKAIHVLGAAWLAMSDTKPQHRSMGVTPRQMARHANGALSVAEGTSYWIKMGMMTRVARMDGDRPSFGYLVNLNQVRKFYDIYNLTDGYGMARYEQFLIYLITLQMELGRPLQRRDAYDLFARGSTIRREVLEENGLIEAHVDPDHGGRYLYQGTDLGNRVTRAYLDLTCKLDEWREEGFRTTLVGIERDQHWMEALRRSTHQNNDPLAPGRYNIEGR